MNTRSANLIRNLVFSLDVGVLNLLSICSYILLFNSKTNSNISYVLFWIALNLSWLLICWFGNLYHERYINSFEQFSKHTLHIYFYWLVLVMLYLFFMRENDLSHLYVFLVLGGQGILLLANRFIYLCVQSYFRKAPHLKQQVIILGFNELARKVARYLEADNINAKVIGFCEEESNIRELSNYPILSPLANAIEFAKQHNVSDIYSVIAPEQDAVIYDVMEKADSSCIHFKLIPDLSFFINQSVHVQYLNDMPLLVLRREPLVDTANRIKKRVFDFCFSLLVTIFILSWLLPLISILIKVTSNGPVFFYQNRLGRNNEIFKVCKFRTMKIVESNNEFIQATKDDARITKVGSFLRKTSLDEFPQFFNVLFGQMSICGPRPHPLKLNDSYKDIVNKYMVRQFLKPGITGWAQVNGYRGETKNTTQMQKRIEHDLWYLENWSLWLDVKIVFLTFYNILRGEEQAY